jgi:hypothetical protein
VPASQERIPTDTVSEEGVIMDRKHKGKRRKLQDEELHVLYALTEYCSSLMELSLSREAASYAVTQELPSILWSTKVH